MRFLTEASRKGTHNVQTADTVVERIGYIDTLTPEVTDPGKIASKIGKKHEPDNVFEAQRKHYYFFKTKMKETNMSTFSCRCGHVIKLQTDRDPEEHVLIKETDIWDRFLQLPTDELAMTGQEFYDFTSDKGADVIICPKCTRVYIDHNGDNRYTAYVNEDNPPAD